MDIKGIKQISESGNNRFKVTVKLKSKTDPSVIVQREKKVGIKTIEQALKIRIKLNEEAMHELIKREIAGAEWGSLISDWETAFATGKVFMAKPISKTTFEDYTQVLRNYTHDWFRTPASEIAPADVARLIHHVAVNLGKSRGVQLKLRTSINTVFEWAIDNGRIKNVVVSPAKNVSLVGRKVEKQQPILNIQQIRKLIEGAKGYEHPWCSIWLFCLHTGARSGEAYAIEWDDVDLDNRRLFISKSFNKRANSIGPTKAGYWREVPINEELLRLLKELRLKKGPNSNFVLPRITNWDRGAQARVLREFCKIIGIPEINFHALRACFATQLLRNGVEAARVMKICGWKELETMQRYIRLAGVEVEGVTDSLKFTTPDEAMAKVVNLFGER